MPTLTSSKYRIKWTRLADFPSILCGAYVAVQDRKIYVSGGSSPVEDTKHQVFAYDIDNDRWGQLPIPDHYYAVPHIIGGKLSLIGGRLIPTNKMTNKVSTFDQTKQSWVSYYPNLLSVRSKPGIATHMEYAIVAGGIQGGGASDDIEILDWVENSQWKRVSIHLPVPMSSLKLAALDNHLFIVGYINADNHFDKHVYELPVGVITNLADQLKCVSTRWVKLAGVTKEHASLVTGLSSLIVVGGYDATVATADMKMYDRTSEKWKKIDSLSFARSSAAAAVINNNAIVVIGGFTKHRSPTDAKSSSLNVVELGQVEKCM